MAAARERACVQTRPRWLPDLSLQPPGRRGINPAPQAPVHGFCHGAPADLNEKQLFTKGPQKIKYFQRDQRHAESYKTLLKEVKDLNK